MSTPWERPAKPGELCTCGRPAVTVLFSTKRGETGYCGLADGGARTGPCPFCGGSRHEFECCPNYCLRLDGRGTTTQSDADRADVLADDPARVFQPPTWRGRL